MDHGKPYRSRPVDTLDEAGDGLASWLSRTGPTNVIWAVHRTKPANGAAGANDRLATHSVHERGAVMIDFFCTPSWVVEAAIHLEQSDRCSPICSSHNPGRARQL